MLDPFTLGITVGALFTLLVCSALAGAAILFVRPALERRLGWLPQDAMLARTKPQQMFRWAASDASASLPIPSTLMSDIAPKPTTHDPISDIDTVVI